ncbi:MAG: phytanoyl-CoA dioxygenase family protein, partial [Actinomycetota bacterium]
MSRPRIFHDRRLDRQFKRRGWVVVSAWDPAVPERLIELDERSGDREADGYHVTAMSEDIDFRRAVDELIRADLAPAIVDLLVGYEPHVGVLVLKEPHGDSTVWAHQDGTCNDEHERPGVIAWIPATPLDHASGFLRGLWGSHRYMPGIRSTPPTPAPFQDVRDELLTDVMPPIELAPGQALLFDSRLVHGSEPNRSGRRRVVGYLRLHPAGSIPCHYWWDTDHDVVHGYEVDRDFFVTHVWNHAPARAPAVSFAP